MCDPITITGIALTGASVGANMLAQSQVASARNDALAAERIRQSGLDQEAAAINARSQDRYQGFEGQQTERGKALGDYFAQQQATSQQANTQAAEQQSVPTTSSNIVVREEGRQRQGARAFSQQQGQALGTLRSFGDLLGGIGRQQARDAGLIGQIGSFKNGSSQVLAHELEAAASAGNGMKFLGDILGLGGSFATAKGLQGSFVNPTSAAPLNIVPSSVRSATGAAGNAAAGSISNLFRLY